MFGLIYPVFKRNLRFLPQLPQPFGSNGVCEAGWPLPANGYSHAVVAEPGKLVFVAGQVANNPQGQLVGKDDLRAQTVQVFENIKTVLASSGASFDDVVKITWYVKAYKPEYLPILREVRSKYVNKANPPASTLVGVTSLFHNDHLIEVDAVAAIPAKRSKKK